MKTWSSIYSIQTNKKKVSTNVAETFIKLNSSNRLTTVKSIDRKISVESPTINYG